MSPPSAHAWDVPRYLPGELAATHDLLSANGKRLSFTFFGPYSIEGGGLFTTWKPGDCGDFQFWGPEYLTYLWFACSGISSGGMSDPLTPTHVVPRYVPAGGSGTIVSPVTVVTRTTYQNGVPASTRSVIGKMFSDWHYREEVVDGETVLRFWTDGPNAFDEHEVDHVVLSDGIAVQGGGSAKGIRSIYTTVEGAQIYDERFVTWVPKET